MAEIELSAALKDGPWVKEWLRRLGAGEQVLATVGTEPLHTQLAICVAARKYFETPVVTWDCVNQFRETGGDKLGKALGREVARLSKPPSNDEPDGLDDPGLCSPLSAILAADRFRFPHLQTEAGTGSVVFIFFNFYCYFGDPKVAQALEILVASGRLNNKGRRRPIHFIQSPIAKLDLKGYTSIEHWIMPMQFPLPDEKELLDDHVTALLKSATELARADKDPAALLAKVNSDPAFLTSLAAACRGLTRTDATKLLFYAATRYRAVDDRVLALVKREAAQTIAASTALEVVSDDEITPPEQLGGVDNALRAIERAARTYTEAARAQFLDPSLGMICVGLPGAGKSELSKTAAQVFQRVTGRAFAVLRVKMGAIYGGIVGDTERNWYAIEERVEAFGPDTIVWMDEADKALGHATETHGDSGVKMSLFGLILTWLANPKRRCYVTVALNDPTGMPPEFMRRFDDRFFFGWPNAQARYEILRIHFAKRLRKMGVSLTDMAISEMEWRDLAACTDKWLPSELEMLVKRSRDLAFERRGEAVPTYTEVKELLAAAADDTLATQKQSAMARLTEACRHYTPVGLPDVAVADTGPQARTLTF